MLTLTAFICAMLLASCQADSQEHGPNIVGLSPDEAKLAKRYFEYLAAEHVLPSGDDGSGKAQLGYRFDIPLPERLAGITYVGLAARLRLVLERARSGEALLIGALGGSITAGQAAGGSRHTYAAAFTDWLNAAMPPTFTKRKGFNEENGQLKHAYICGAVPGTTSAYMSSCVTHHLPKGADLVFIEYAVNDSPVPSVWFTEPIRRAMERLIRKVLTQPNQPAVILVNMYAYHASRGKYFRNAERDFYELGSYYSVPMVSLKAAVVPAASSTSKGRIAAPEVAINAIFNGGSAHPGRGGHVVVLELLVTLSLNLLSTNNALQFGEDTAFPLALTSGGGGSGSSKGASGSSVAASDQPLDGDIEDYLEFAADRNLPPPMCENNYESAKSTCYVEEDLKPLILEPVSGWNWTDEGRGKWGWVTEATKQKIRLEINTQLKGKRSSASKSMPIVVSIAYLQSYYNMGAASVSCVSGCSCVTTTVDGFDPRPVSITGMADMQVTQHPECTLEVTSIGPGKEKRPTAMLYEPVEGEGGASRGNKFKLMGVVIGEEPGASHGSVNWMRSTTFSVSQVIHGRKKPK